MTLTQSETHIFIYVTCSVYMVPIPPDTHTDLSHSQLGGSYKPELLSLLLAHAEPVVGG